MFIVLFCNNILLPLCLAVCQPYLYSVCYTLLTLQYNGLSFCGIIFSVTAPAQTSYNMSRLAGWEMPYFIFIKLFFALFGLSK